MTTQPFWITAFLDFAPNAFDPGVRFWRDVTGYGLSATRGDHDEFATLVPGAGDDYLRVQRLRDGESRLHLDVHVADPRDQTERVVGLGAEIVEHLGGHVVLTSPGGLTFCLVNHPAGTRPDPTRWPDGSESFVDQVCLDIPPSAYGAEFDFWEQLTGWQRQDSEPYSEFGRLNPPAGIALQLLVQRLDDEEERVRAHLDWAASDRETETDRHLGAGAELVRRFEGWTLLRDPAGLAYCITGRTPNTRCGEAPHLDSVCAVTTIQRVDPHYASDERTMLLGFLDYHRDTLRLKCDGLDQVQLAQRLEPSTMTLGGMMKHLAFVEHWWFDCMFLGEEYAEPWASIDWESDQDWDWDSAVHDTPEQIRALFDEAVAHSDEVVAGVESLDHASARTSRRNDEHFTLRWILVHMVEEYARHNGHADLIRESIDGNTGE